MGRNDGYIRSKMILRLLIPLLLTVAAGCAKLEEPSKQENVTLGFPDVEIFQASINYTRGEMTRFKVKAPHLSRFEKIDLLLLEGGIEVDMFDSKGEHTGLLTAEKGEVLERKQHLLARGNVVVHADGGIVLYADSLYYNPETERVISDGFVIIVSPDDSLAGYGFSASPNLEDWEIKNTSGTTWRTPPDKGERR